MFIDEVDALLGKRGMHSEHEATLQVREGKVGKQAGCCSVG